MNNKLNHYARYLTFSLAISLLLLLPFTQLTTAQTKKLTNTKNQRSEVTINKFDTNVAYQIWTQYYQAQEKGINSSFPVFEPFNVTDEERKNLMAMWNQGKKLAHKDFLRRNQQKLKNTNTSQKQDSTIKLKKFDTSVAYKIWTQYYQEKEKGINSPPPNFNPINADAQSTNRLMAMWKKGHNKAYNDYLLRLEQKPNNPKLTNLLKSVGLENVVTLSSNAANNTTYDNNGNITSADGKAYGYDYENRLTSITGNGLNISLIYNGDGDLVSKTINGVTTSYLVDRNNTTGLSQVVEEIQNGQVIKQYTHGADGLISQRQLIDGQRVTSFYGKDGHGSVRYLTDSNGNITDAYDYDAFGNLINRTGNTPNDYLYAGERLDSDLGFYYLRARFLNTVTGRFLTQDTFEGTNNDPLSLHKYTYTKNNPINNIDPSGLDGIATFGSNFAISSIITSMPNIQSPGIANYFEGSKGRTPWNQQDENGLRDYIQGHFFEYIDQEIDCADLSIELLAKYAKTRLLRVKLKGYNNTIFDTDTADGFDRYDTFKKTAQRSIDAYSIFHSNTYEKGSFANNNEKALELAKIGDLMVIDRNPGGRYGHTRVYLSHSDQYQNYQGQTIVRFLQGNLQGNTSRAAPVKESFATVDFLGRSTPSLRWWLPFVFGR
jgi:RHS repeat-associated protein